MRANEEIQFLSEKEALFQRGVLCGLTAHRKKRRGIEQQHKDEKGPGEDNGAGHQTVIVKAVQQDRNPECLAKTAPQGKCVTA